MKEISTEALAAREGLSSQRVRELAREDRITHARRDGDGWRFKTGSRIIRTPAERRVSDEQVPADHTIKECRYWLANLRPRETK